MIESFLDGVRWGLFFLGALTPFAVLLALLVSAFRLLRKEKVVIGELIEEGLIEDEPPFFDYGEDPEVFRPEVDIRYIPSTIVRPPNVVSREEAEKEDDKDD